MSEYQRIQAEIGQDRLTLDQAKFKWEQIRAQWLQERTERIDRLAEQERKRAIAAETRALRFDREETLLSAGLDRADLVNRATLGALPFLAPKTEFLPGQGPGGAMARLSEQAGAEFTPIRTEDVTVAFDPASVADEAIRNFEARSGQLFEEN